MTLAHRIRRVAWAIVAAMSLHLDGALAASLRPLDVDTLHALTSGTSRAPVLVAFWSLDCMYCKEDMTVLDAFARKHRDVKLKIVSTDTTDDAEPVEAALKSYGVDRYDNWIFADPIPERIRSTFDPAWHGELPRTYFYIDGVRLQSTSGRMSEATLEQWYASGRRKR
jgi:thiol-disulfide isomerase/thioredoxin